VESEFTVAFFCCHGKNGIYRLTTNIRKLYIFITKFNIKLVSLSVPLLKWEIMIQLRCRNRNLTSLK